MEGKAHTHQSTYKTITVSPSSSALPHVVSCASESIMNHRRIPLLEITGVRPICALLTLISAVVQMYAAISSLFDSDCLLVGSYVLSVGILSIILFVGIILMPILFGRTNCLLVILRQFCWTILSLLIPWFTVFNALGGWWVHIDNCWSWIKLRKLAVMDIILCYVMIIIGVWYVFRNMILSSRWWYKYALFDRRFRQLSGFIQRHLRTMLLTLSLGLLIGNLGTLYSYDNALINSYHWSFSSRPRGACPISCKSAWSANKRSRICLNGKEEQIHIQYCLDNLAASHMLPSNHLMLQPCPKLNCTSSTGALHRHHWSLRDELLVSPPHVCSKHERSVSEQVSLVQEVGCYDEQQRVWVDDLFCDSQPPLFTSFGKKVNYRLLYWKDRHCLHQCQAMSNFTSLCALIQFIAVAALITNWFGPRFLHQQHSTGYSSLHHKGDESDVDATSMTTSTISLASATSTTSPSATMDIRYLRHELQTRNTQSWFIGRLGRSFLYATVYGLDVLPFIVQLVVRTALSLTILGMTFLASLNMMWLSDSHCRYFTPVGMANAGTIFSGFAMVCIRLLDRAQLKSSSNHDSTQPRLKEEVDEDR